MATATVTVTAKTGPAKTVTTQAFAGIKSLVLDFDRQVFMLYCNKEGHGPVKEFDMASITVLTDVIAGAGLGHTIATS